MTNLGPIADKILIDAPCTGSGVIRREPVKKYSSMLKAGGAMVYSTCSLFPTENQHPVRDFLSTHSGFVLEAEKMLWPSAIPGDGFYMAKIKKIP